MGCKPAQAAGRRGRRAGGLAAGPEAAQVAGRRRRREGIALGRPNEAVQNGERGGGGGVALLRGAGAGGRSIIHDMAGMPARSTYADKACKLHPL